jgi:signal transduction histidine kinase/CheY-like chemotaxis protein
LLSALWFLAAGVLISILASRFVSKPFYKIEEQNRSLAELNEMAVAASEAKSSFLANMSHEMRTPLNAVIGLSELTLNAGRLEEEDYLNLEKISNSGITLLSTVNDILDISKIEAGKFNLIPVEYHTPSLLNDTITQNIMRIGERPIQFILNIDEKMPERLYGDDLRVRQIFNNLLSNAFKYTREGTVELCVNHEREEETVWLIASVKDTGIGIREEDLNNLFGNFIQVDTKSHRKIEGTGLGLSITKKMAEMMDGTVTVKSEYGKGSAFTVKLRQRFVDDAPIGAEVIESLKKFQYSDQKRIQNSRLVRIKLPGARVLVVDDVVTNLDVAKGMMKPYGMQIDCVTSGQEAIDLSRDGQVRYNAIFMDHMMPGMDGIEATRIIREEIGTPYAKTVPIIAFTANALVGNEEMFLGKGFQSFLSKPIEIARLDAVIKEWVRVDENCLPGFNESEAAEGAGTGWLNFAKKISGLEIDKGIERFSGDSESYLQVLQSYASNTPPLLMSAKKVTIDKLGDYAIIVHGIKSSSRSICAEAVGNMAEALEKAAKEGNFDFVTANNAQFIEASEKLIYAIIEMQKQITGKMAKQKKDKINKDVLEKLKSSCEVFAIDGVDKAMAELELYEYKSDNELAAWLRENIDQMNYTEILERLSGENGKTG